MAKWIVPLCIAFALAVFLWPRPGLYETDIFVPVEITALPEGLTLNATPLKGVEIRIRGPEKMIRDLPNQALSYPLDLSGLGVGVASVPIRPELFGLPSDITVLHVHPNPVIFRIENGTTKELPIVVTVNGTPASGFYVESIQPVPATVVLRGPETRLGPVDEIRTKPIDINGVHESIKKEVALDLVEGVAPVAPGGVVLAEVRIGEQEATWTFSHIPVTGKNTSYRFTVSPSQIGIEVKGPVNTLKKIEAEGIEVYVDLEGLSPGVYPRRAVIPLPIEATLLQATPEIFTVSIQPQARPQAGAPATPGT